MIYLNKSYETVSTGRKKLMRELLYNIVDVHILEERQGFLTRLHGQQ